MDEATKLGFEFAKEVATQLITLSTGLLGLTITFTKDIFKSPPERGAWLLPAAWGIHVLAIGFGVMTLMGLTGTLMPADMKTRMLIFGDNVRLPAKGQIVAFGLGTICLVVYGLLAFRSANAASPSSIYDPAD